MPVERRSPQEIAAEIVADTLAGHKAERKGPTAESERAYIKALENRKGE